MMFIFEENKKISKYKPIHAKYCGRKMQVKNPGLIKNKVAKKTINHLELPFLSPRKGNILKRANKFSGKKAIKKASGLNMKKA